MGGFMERIVNFFKDIGLYNEDYFNMLISNTKIINKPYNEIMDFVGCFKSENSCKVILPKIKNFNDELIYVHEYTHALFLDDENEIFPNIMEALYINYYVDDINLKKELILKIKSEIKKSNSKGHVIGKKVKIMSIKL